MSASTPMPFHLNCKTKLKSKLCVTEEETQSDPICARQHTLPTEVSCSDSRQSKVMQVGAQICCVVQGA